MKTYFFVVTLEKRVDVGSALLIELIGFLHPRVIDGVLLHRRLTGVEGLTNLLVIELMFLLRLADQRQSARRRDDRNRRSLGEPTNHVNEIESDRRSLVVIPEEVNLERFPRPSVGDQPATNHRLCFSIAKAKKERRSLQEALESG